MRRSILLLEEQDSASSQSSPATIFNTSNVWNPLQTWLYRHSGDRKNLQPYFGPHSTALRSYFGVAVCHWLTLHAYVYCCFGPLFSVTLINNDATQLMFHETLPYEVWRRWIVYQSDAASDALALEFLPNLSHYVSHLLFVVQLLLRRCCRKV